MKKKIMLLAIIMTLLSGCSFEILAQWVNPDYSIPTISYPIVDISTNFEVPNEGAGLTNKEFFKSYSDYDDYDYVLENFKSADAIKQQDLHEIHSHFNSNSPHQENEYTGRYAGYNLINILSESLEMRFASPTLTPTLWRIMQNSMYFENFYVSEFQEGATCNSEFMSMSGLLPVVNSVWGANMCQNKDSTNDIYKFALPAQMKANGYDTYYFHGGFKTFYNRQNFIPNLGFTKGEDVKFLDDMGYEKNNYIIDAEMIRFFDEFIDFEQYKSGEKQFYVNLLTYSLHGAYSAASLGVNEQSIAKVYDALEVDSSFFEGNEEVLYYLAKLTHYDALLEKLYDLLQENELADNTLLIICRDHHPYIMNNNKYTWYMNKVIEGGFDTQSIDRFRQPLVIADLGNLDNGQEVIPHAGGLLDLPPTIINLLGLTGNYRHFFGNDILSGNSYAFLSNQNLSQSASLVTDGQGNTSELIKGYSGDIELEEEMNNFLARKLIQLALMEKIIQTDYFSYYYFSLPIGKWQHADDIIEIRSSNVIIFNGVEVACAFYVNYHFDIVYENEIRLFAYHAGGKDLIEYTNDELYYTETA